MFHESQVTYTSLGMTNNTEGACLTVPPIQVTGEAQCVENEKAIPDSL